MATGGLTPLRGNNVYVGWAKESVWGTPVAPTNFWRWLDGSAAKMTPKISVEREGDTSPHKSLAWKSEQSGDIKIVEYCRPRTMGCALQAMFGTGSDTYTAPTKSTTFSNSPAAGATSFISVGDLGNLGTAVAFNFSPGVAQANYEVLTVDCTSRTGTGPWTYSLAAGVKFANAHVAAEGITNASTHVFTRGLTSYDPYSVEVGRGDGSNAPFQVVRYVDAVCHEVTLTSEANKPLKLEHSWYAADGKLITGNAAVVLEGASQIGNSASPFMHSFASNWSLNSLTTGNALTVKKCVVHFKNTTNVSDFVLEKVQPAYFTIDNWDVEIQLTVKFNSFNDYYMCYFGNTTAPAANTLDSHLVGYGQLSATWVEDGINSVALSVPYCSYGATELPFKLDGRPVDQQIILTPLKSASNAQPVTLTLSNSQNSAY
jgi:hypothetical protein